MTIPRGAVLQLFVAWQCLRSSDPLLFEYYVYHLAWGRACFESCETLKFPGPSGRSVCLRPLMCPLPDFRWLRQLQEILRVETTFFFGQINTSMFDKCLRNIIELIVCDMSASDLGGFKLAWTFDVTGGKCAITSHLPTTQRSPSYPGFRVGKKRSNYPSRYELQGTWGVCCGAVDVNASAAVQLPHTPGCYGSSGCHAAAFYGSSFNAVSGVERALKSKKTPVKHRWEPLFTPAVCIRTLEDRSRYKPWGTDRSIAMRRSYHTTRVPV